MVVSQMDVVPFQENDHALVLQLINLNREENQKMTRYFDNEQREEDYF